MYQSSDIASITFLIYRLSAMTPIQSRMARAALSWRGSDLARAAGIGTATLARFELGQPVASETVEALRAAINAAGIELIESNAVSRKGGEGVRLREPANG